MIVASRKPLEEIIECVEAERKILVAGCGACVAVCMAGGEKEAELLSIELRMALKLRGRAPDIKTATIQRQCEEEFVQTLASEVEDRDVVISIGCGAGVQFLAKTFADKRIVPGLNTEFIGVVTAPGEFEEVCAACGDCILHLTGGICPIARCSKSLLNGPCGGSSNGHCEIGEEAPCAWQLIFDKLKAAGRLDLMARIHAPKNWSTSRDGGPRRATRKEQKR
jgi:ferredoxin